MSVEDYHVAAANGPNTLDFEESYSLYREVRDELHGAQERGFGPHGMRAITGELTAAREQVALSVHKESQYCGTTQQLREFIGRCVTSHAGAEADMLRAGVTDPLLAARLIPASHGHSDMPNPIESAIATADNLAIVNSFIEAGGEPLDGLILSGANAWGRHFAVKGGIPEPLVQAGVPQLEYGKFSDIDMLVTAEGLDSLEAVLDNYMRAGLVGDSERERFETFRGLYAADEADIFSIRAHYRGVEESVHFVPADVLRRVCDMEPMNQKSQGSLAIDTIRDFRVNLPGAVLKRGHYTVSDLKGLSEAVYVPSPKGVSADDGRPLGFISDSPLGTRAVYDGVSTYHMGLLTFFMSVAPEVVHDKSGMLSQHVEMLQKNIAAAMDGGEVRHLPRQERMASYALAHVRSLLSF